ncbi:MAG: DUF4382 domain-containing protein [Deltaproteobacteria bacterium]|nr:DUF4382 domain-containing protein [Deltaproteobacteria bacterium]
MFRFLKLNTASLMIAGSLGLFACGQGTTISGSAASTGKRAPLSSGYGRIVLGLTTTGAPTVAGQTTTTTGNANVKTASGGGPVTPGVDLTEIVVDIDEVKAHVAGTGWVSVMREQVVTVDLLKLQAKVGELGFADIPPGKVTQIRLHVVEGSAPYVTTPDGVQHKLETPSGMQSGLKLKGMWDLDSCSSTHITLVFDKKSIHVVKTGHQDRYVLRPVIRIGPSRHDSIDCRDDVPPTVPTGSGDPNDPNVGDPNDPNDYGDPNDFPGSTDPNDPTDGSGSPTDGSGSPTDGSGSPTDFPSSGSIDGSGTGGSGTGDGTTDPSGSTDGSGTGGSGPNDFPSSGSIDGSGTGDTGSGDGTSGSTDGSGTGGSGDGSTLPGDTTGGSTDGSGTSGSGDGSTLPGDTTGTSGGTSGTPDWPTDGSTSGVPTGSTDGSGTTDPTSGTSGTFDPNDPTGTGTSGTIDGIPTVSVCDTGIDCLSGDYCSGSGYCTPMF